MMMQSASAIAESFLLPSSSPSSFPSDVASASCFHPPRPASSATSLRCSSPAASTTTLHSSTLDFSSASLTKLHAPPSQGVSVTSVTELDETPSNVASSTSFPYVTELRQPFQKDLRASLCTDVHESVRPTSAAFHDPFGSWEKDSPSFSPLTSSGYNCSDLGPVGLPWRPSFKTTREMLKRRPATAIKMTYMSVKEKMDQEVDANNLAMVSLT